MFIQEGGGWLYCWCVLLQLSGSSSLALELNRNYPIGQDRDGIIPTVSRKATNIYHINEINRKCRWLGFKTKKKYNTDVPFFHIYISFSLHIVSNTCIELRLVFIADL